MAEGSPSKSAGHGSLGSARVGAFRYILGLFQRVFGGSPRFFPGFLKAFEGLIR